MSIRIKNGTPLNGASLCETCSFSHIERGYRANEERVVCRAVYPAHAVSFRVRECSSYSEMKRQTLERMEEIAWVLTPRGGKRQAGFVPASELRRQEDGEGIELILNDEK